MKVDRKTMLAAVRKCRTAVGITRPLIAYPEADRLRLEGRNGRMMIRMTIPVVAGSGDGKMNPFAVKVRTLVNMLTAVGGDQLMLEPDDKMLTIRSDNGGQGLVDIELPSERPLDVPPRSDMVDIDPRPLCDAILGAAGWCSTDDHPMFGAVRLAPPVEGDGLRVVASDTYRLLVQHVHAPMPAWMVGWHFPKNSLKKLITMVGKRVTVGVAERDEVLWVEVRGGMFGIKGSRADWAKFETWDTRGERHPVRVPDVSQAERLLGFARQAAAAETVAHVTVEPDALVLETKGKIVLNVRVECEPSDDAVGVRTAFNGRFLADTVGAMGGPFVWELANPSRFPQPARFEAEHHAVALQMPVRP